MTHSEGDANGDNSYHAPGWPSPFTPSGFVLPPNWDFREYGIVSAVRNASFSINNEVIADYPTPNAPKVVLNSTSPVKLSWQGSAWANTYEIWGESNAPVAGDSWKLIKDQVLDAVGAGNLSYPFPEAASLKAIKMRGVTLTGGKGDWSNVLEV